MSTLDENESAPGGKSANMSARLSVWLNVKDRSVTVRVRVIGGRKGREICLVRIDDVGDGHRDAPVTVTVTVAGMGM